jgi:hypothetical protein
MRARLRSFVFGLAVLGASGGMAKADPKPTVVDIKPIRDQLVVLQDGKGGTYIVSPVDPRRVWYGTGKELYQQRTVGFSANGDAWTISTWAPRLEGIVPAYVLRTAEGTFQMTCGNADDDKKELTLLTGDKAKKILDSHVLMTAALVRRPKFFARDDSGVYYYVDVIGGSEANPSKTGPRLFVGKKGAVKEIELTDAVIDSAGEVFTSKTGELRLVHSHEDGKEGAAWVHGDKRTDLIKLDMDANSHVIFSELGVYKFIGTLCDNL